PMIRMLRVLGIEDVPCPPHRPDKKPFVERCIETLKYEHFARFAPTTLAEAQAVLANFPHYYNEQRPHQGQACQNRPPEIAFPTATLPKLPTLPDMVHPRTTGLIAFRDEFTGDGSPVMALFRLIGIPMRLAAPIGSSPSPLISSEWSSLWNIKA
ncbi:MAG: transposase, partial [Anaerolineae bacterium]|nr:transposase [Anaerolineae bacterium]